MAVSVCPPICLSVEKWFLDNNSFSSWHTKMILHKCIDREPRKTSIYFGVKGQGQIWTLNFLQFRMITPFPFEVHRYIITDSVLLWKIQKFDWLIPETKWHSCLHNRTLCMHNRTLCSETRIHSNRVEPEKTIDSKSIKTFHCLTERWYVAIIARCDVPRPCLLQ